MGTLLKLVLALAAVLGMKQTVRCIVVGDKAIQGLQYSQTIALHLNKNTQVAVAKTYTNKIFCTCTMHDLFLQDCLLIYCRKRTEQHACENPGRPDP